MKSQLRKRIESFLWRSLMMGIAAMMAYASQNVSRVGLGNTLVVIIGLIFGEISKFIYNQYRE